MSKHTAGPWVAEDPRFEMRLTGQMIWTTTGMLIGQIAGQATFDYENARLIAAAPDLLEACLAIKAEAESCNDYLLLDKSSPEYRQLLSAIARATEGQL